MNYILQKLRSYNIRFEIVNNKCIRVYGNFNGYSVIRESNQKDYIEVDGKLITYNDFDKWLYQIKT